MIPFFFPACFIPFLVGSVRDQTRGVAHAKQMLCHRVIPPARFMPHLGYQTTMRSGTVKEDVASVYRALSP